MKQDVQNHLGRLQILLQLYISDPYACVNRPVQELAGFKRITLLPGEKKTIVFTMKASQLAFMDRKLQWKIEKGEIEVQLGSSSNDIRLKDSFFINNNAWIEGKDRGFYASAAIKA